MTAPVDRRDDGTDGGVPPEEVRSSRIQALLVLVALVLLARSASLPTILMVAGLVVMIFLHELGHYLTAKAAGMKVTEFFLGFGPRLWSFRRGETEYGIKAIPAGAYVKIIGMSNLEEVDPAEEERTYRAKPYWRRMSVALAGSTMHFLMAILLAWGVFSGFGIRDADSDRWRVASVGEDSPADVAGLQAGDRLVTIDGRPVGDFDETSALLRRNPGRTVSLVVERDGSEQRLSARLDDRHPITGESVGYLGVSPEFPAERVGPVTGFVESVKELGTMAKQSVVGLGNLFSPSGVSDYVGHLTGSIDGDGSGDGGVAENVNRPTSVVGIVQVGSEAGDAGLVNVVYLLFGVNVFIGIFNLIPLLPFDGGHAVIATYEKIRSLRTGRRYYADVAKLMPLTYAVVVVLGLLFVTSIYLDIADPISIN